MGRSHGAQGELQAAKMKHGRVVLASGLASQR